MKRNPLSAFLLALYEIGTKIARFLRSKFKTARPVTRLGKIASESVPTETELETRNKILPRLEDLYNPSLTVDQRMDMIIDILGEERRTSFPILGRYYTYRYMVTTKQEQWDYHPLIVCVDYTETGWKGISFHWNEFRNYSRDGMRSSLYEVYDEELKDLMSVPYMKIVKT